MWRCEMLQEQQTTGYLFRSCWSLAEYAHDCRHPHVDGNRMIRICIYTYMQTIYIYTPTIYIYIHRQYIYIQTIYIYCLYIYILSVYVYIYCRCIYIYCLHVCIYTYTYHPVSINMRMATIMCILGQGSAWSEQITGCLLLLQHLTSSHLLTSNQNYPKTRLNSIASRTRSQARSQKSLSKKLRVEMQWQSVSASATAMSIRLATLTTKSTNLWLPKAQS